MEVKITMTVTISGGNKLQSFLDKIKKQKARVDVGFFPESTYTDGTQVAAVAIWQEFGTESDDGKQHIPPRAFMHPTYQENKSKWLKVLEKVVMNQGENIDIKKALNSVGFIAQKDIQDKIDWWAESGNPRNAEATIKIKSGERYGEFEVGTDRKVGDSPLIWSGHMRESVEFKVTIK